MDKGNVRTNTETLQTRARPKTDSGPGPFVDGGMRSRSKGPLKAMNRGILYSPGRSTRSRPPASWRDTRPHRAHTRWRIVSALSLPPWSLSSVPCLPQPLGYRLFPNPRSAAARTTKIRRIPTPSCRSTDLPACVSSPNSFNTGAGLSISATHAPCLASTPARESLAPAVAAMDLRPNKCSPLLQTVVLAATKSHPPCYKQAGGVATNSRPTCYKGRPALLRNAGSSATNSSPLRAQATAAASSAGDDCSQQTATATNVGCSCSERRPLLLQGRVQAAAAANFPRRCYKRRPPVLPTPAADASRGADGHGCQQSCRKLQAMTVVLRAGDGGIQTRGDGAAMGSIVGDA
jgi:hypothetical protein